MAKVVPDRIFSLDVHPSAHKVGLVNSSARKVGLVIPLLTRLV